MAWTFYDHILCIPNMGTTFLLFISEKKRKLLISFFLKQDFCRSQSNGSEWVRIENRSSLGTNEPGEDQFTRLLHRIIHVWSDFLITSTSIFFEKKSITKSDHLFRIPLLGTSNFPLLNSARIFPVIFLVNRNTFLSWIGRVLAYCCSLMGTRFVEICIWTHLQSSVRKTVFFLPVQKEFKSTLLEFHSHFQPTVWKFQFWPRNLVIFRSFAVLYN